MTLPENGAWTLALWVFYLQGSGALKRTDPVFSRCGPGRRNVVTPRAEPSCCRRAGPIKLADDSGLSNPDPAAR
jgi:hypothetical protein